MKKIYFNQKNKSKKKIRNIGTRVLSAVLLVGLLAGGILGQSGFSGGEAEAAENVKISAAYFPDPNFRDYILNNLDKDKDGYLSTEERKIKYLDVDDKDISSLEGIGWFPELVTISCRGNDLETLDTSNNPNLISIECTGNNIKSLDLSHNLELQALWCYNNEISKLDVSMCKNLTSLHATRCGMTKIILGNHPQLWELHLDENELESIDVSGCPKLRYLEINRNKLTELDVNNCKQLKGLYCNFNLLKKLEIKNLTELEMLFCMGNQFRTLNINDDYWPLRSLYCDADIMKQLDPERLSRTENLGCLVYLEAESDSDTYWKLNLESFEGDLSKFDSRYYGSGSYGEEIHGNKWIWMEKDLSEDIYVMYHYSEQRNVRIYVRPYESSMINLLAEPKNVVKDSGNAVFSVKAEGDGLTYQWYKRAPGETTWSKSGSPGNDTDTLTVKVLEERNGYQYRCLMNNRYGVKKYSKTVTFYYAKPAVITKQPEDVRTLRDKTVKFSVQATGDELTYRWYYNNPYTNRWLMCETTSGRTTNTITVDAGAVISGFQYRCVVKDKYGTTVTSKEVTLTIIPLPEITIQPYSSLVTGHGDTEHFLRVFAKGENLTYQWQKKPEGETIWKNCTGESAKTNIYSFFTNLQERKIQYRCVITDSYGQQVISNTTLVEVRQWAKVTKEPKSVAAKSGNAVFQIEAEGDGITYQWYWRKNDASDWGICGFPGARTKAMTVEVISARNNYQYYCEVKDRYGSIAKSETVKLYYGNPTTITKQPVSLTNVAGTAAKFTVAATGDGLTYQWYWRKNSSADWGVCGFTGSKTNTMTVDAITARNGFNYKCVVTDKYGIKTESKAVVLTVKTYANITVQPRSVMQTSGQAKFSVTAVGDGLTYQWYWRRNASYAWGACGFTGCKTNTMTVDVISARNGFEYRCEVKDKYGNIKYSNPATIYAEEPTAITLQPKSINAQKGTVITFSVGTNKASSKLTYQWYWRKNSSSEWGLCGFTGSRTSSMMVEAILARNGYQYQCVIKDQAGTVLTTRTATLNVFE